MYRIRANGIIVRMDDGAAIPPDELNADYQRYLVDAEAGAIVELADDTEDEADGN